MLKVSLNDELVEVPPNTSLGEALPAWTGADGAAPAVALYQKALEKDHLNESAYWELGWSYQILDRWEDALAAWDALKKLNPKYPELELYYPIIKMRRDHQDLLLWVPIEQPDRIAGCDPRFADPAERFNDSAPRPVL